MRMEYLLQKFQNNSKSNEIVICIVVNQHIYEYSSDGDQSVDTRTCAENYTKNSLKDWANS